MRKLSTYDSKGSLLVREQLGHYGHVGPAYSWLCGLGKCLNFWGKVKPTVEGQYPSYGLRGPVSIDETTGQASNRAP